MQLLLLDLTFEGFSVDDRGNIRIPIIGELNVMGLTLEEVRIKVEKELLENYFNKEANIFVIVKMAGLRFTINGEINVAIIVIFFKVLQLAPCRDC